MIHKIGKKTVLLGLCINLIATVIFAVILSVSYKFRMFDNVLTTLLGYVVYLSIGITAFGFFMMWLFDRDMKDFMVCIAMGISAILGILICLRYEYITGAERFIASGILSVIGIVKHGNWFINFVVLGLLNLFYVVVAFRARNRSGIISLLLLCGFIYRVFSGMIFMHFLYLYGTIPVGFLILGFIGYIICAGTSLVEIKTEN